MDQIVAQEGCGAFLLNVEQWEKFTVRNTWGMGAVSRLVLAIYFCYSFIYMESST